MPNSEIDPNREQTVRDLLGSARQKLADAESIAIEGTDSTSHRLDAEVLLLHVLGKDRPWLYAHPDAVMEPSTVQRFYKAVQLRLEKLPIAYITGHQEFWSLDIVVSPSVLVPRAETELLVELVLDAVKNRQGASVLELGTGSGAISIALHSEQPDLHIVATDISAEALEVAKRNQQIHNATGIRFVQSNWFENINQQFDLIISNPPYIATGDPHLRLPGVCNEPNLALTSGSDGLDAIRHIASNAKHYLISGGQLLFEHGYDQSEVANTLLDKLGYQNIQCHHDHAGNARVTSAVL